MAENNNAPPGILNNEFSLDRPLSRPLLYINLSINIYLFILPIIILQRNNLQALNINNDKLVNVIPESYMFQY